MKIRLNGRETETACTTLLELVAEQDLETASLIAEYNFQVVRQEVWQNTRLSDGDVVELLSFVGGG